MSQPVIYTAYIKQNQGLHPASPPSLYHPPASPQWYKQHDTVGPYLTLPHTPSRFFHFKIYQRMRFLESYRAKSTFLDKGRLNRSCSTVNPLKLDKRKRTNISKQAKKAKKSGSIPFNNSVNELTNDWVTVVNRAPLRLFKPWNESHGSYLKS